ncbi:MAG: lipocalin-like domain-containing protein [Duncaniella sp.]|nr:lipocalin-like domain-containing protein [Duncaniella sp.]
MRLRIYNIFFLMVMAAGFLTGCTQNDGDIGPWFGRWRLDKMTCDGKNMDIYADADIRLVYWSFQNNIVRVAVQHAHDVEEITFGRWSQQDDLLLLDFTASGDPVDNPGIFTPPAILHFESDEINRLTINEMTDSYLDLSHHGADGRLYQYFLKKVI